jgi:hypothetical protein
MHSPEAPLLFYEGTLVTEAEQVDNRKTLTEALDLVIDHSNVDDVEIKRVEIDVMGTGDVIFRIYPRDGSESERGTVTAT